MRQLVKKSVLFLFLLTLSIVARPQAAIVPGDALVMLRAGASARAIAADLVRVDGEDWVADSSHFLHGRWLVLRRGKRNIAGIQRVD